MLTKPEHGWINLQINDFSERASYMTDIPNECLDAFINALQNSTPAVIFFDAEGWDFHLVASYYCSYIIVDKDDAKLFTVSKNIHSLAKELYDDIKNNLDDWTNWYLDEADTEEERKGYRRVLEEKLSQLNMEINQ